MACRIRVGLILLFALLIFSTSATASPGDFKLHQTLSPIHKAVSEAAEALISGMGWSDKEVKISHIDTVDAKVGSTVMYEFDIELGENVFALRVTEDMPIWKYIEELPTEISESSDASALRASRSWQLQDFVANLDSFQLSGPAELLIQDAELLRLAVPDDVEDDIEAGDLKKVLLAEGAVVTVEGAREVSLVQPLQLPLPLPGISKDGGLAASLLAIADRLRYASRAEKPLLSLKIVGPTSMAASSTYPSKSSLKVERLAHGAIKLESHEQQEQDLMSTARSSVNLQKSEGEDAWLWPLPSMNVSDSKLMDLERVLLSAMGPSMYKKGYFELLRAKVSMATFVQVEFQLERKLAESSFPPELWPEWRTQPSVERLEFEVLARVEGEELTSISVQVVKPYANEETWTWSALMGKAFPSKMPRVFLPPSTMTLNHQW